MREDHAPLEEPRKPPTLLFPWVHQTPQEKNAPRFSIPDHKDERMVGPEDRDLLGRGRILLLDIDCSRTRRGGSLLRDIHKCLVDYLPQKQLFLVLYPGEVGPHPEGTDHPHC